MSDESVEGLQYLWSSMAGEGVDDVVCGPTEATYLRVTDHGPIRGRYGITESRTGPACFLLHTLATVGRSRVDALMPCMFELYQAFL